MNAWKRATRTLIWWVIVIVMAAGVGAIVALFLAAVAGCGRRTVKEIRVTAGYVWLAQANLEQYADEMEADNPQGAKLLRAISRPLARAVVEINRRRLKRVLIRDRYRRKAGDLLDLAESSIGPPQATTRPAEGSGDPSGPTGLSESPGAAPKAPRSTTQSRSRPTAYTQREPVTDL